MYKIFSRIMDNVYKWIKFSNKKIKKIDVIMY